MRKIGSIFKVWETDFGSPGGHFWPLEAKSDLWEASSRVWTPDPRPRTLIFASGRPKSVVRRQISPLGERILTSPRGQNPVDLANFGVQRSPKGQFQGSQPGKGSRVVAPNGDRFSILGPRRIRKSWRSPKCVPNLTQMWVWKLRFHKSQVKILYLVPSFCLFRSCGSFITKKEGVGSQI